MDDCKKKLIRITTVPQSMKGLLKGQLKLMKSYYDVLAVSSDGACFEEMLEEQGNIRGVKINMSRQITPIQDLVSLYQLIRLFQKEKPYIVHTHTPKAGTLGMIAAWLTRVPHRIHTVAGLPLLVATGWKRRLLDVVEKITYACATRVYPNSFRLKNIIVENRLASERKLGVIGKGSSNGIDTTYFSSDALLETKEELRKRLGYSLDDFVFVFVGRLVKDKGINELVASFIRLNRENKQVKLLLVGPFEKELDPLNVETEEAINTHQAIQWVGFQKDVRPYFKVADALAFPSYREGFPNVVLQAGAMGLPSVVTDINGCNEIIIEGENGCIIPPQNEEGLFLAMRQFITDRKEVEQMASNARSLIQTRYEQQNVWKALLEMYQSLDK